MQGAANTNDIIVTALTSDIMRTLTVTSGHRVTPPPVRLADSPIARPRECHPLLAPASQRHVCDMGTRGHVRLSPEGDHGVECGPAALEPAIGKDAGGAAVDF